MRNIPEAAWLDFIERTMETMDIGLGARVFAVGCGAGEFLYPLALNGYAVGGIDSSVDLVDEARVAIPSGSFSVGDASTLDPAEPWDVVLACGTFETFPDLNHARGVLARMGAKATHAIALLDVPDLDLRHQAPESTGLFFDRAWMLRALAEIGAKAIQIEDQKIDGDQNARFRFNVFARL